MKPFLLDSGPLGKLANPRRHPEIAPWLDRQLLRQVPIYISEVADFEVRRSLLLDDLRASLARLDAFQQILNYAPITTADMRLAAEMWAAVRRRGKPTADPKALDCDVIIAAQAKRIGAIIVIENIDHLALLANAKHWRDLST